MVFSTPKITFPTEEEKILIEVDIYKCCTVDGKYRGSSFIHDPEVPGDGPWTLVIQKQGVTVRFGFGTKAEAVAAAHGLTLRYDERLELDIDDLED